MHPDRTTNHETKDSSFHDLLYQLEQVLFLLAIVLFFSETIREKLNISSFGIRCWIW